MKISLLLIMLPRRSFRERERERNRYDDAIWCKYPNYTISFSTTREFKRRIESPTILSSIQISIDLLFVLISSHLYRSIPSDFTKKFVRTENQLPIQFISHSASRTSSRTKYKGIQSYSSWRKISIDGDLEIDLKK